MLHTYGPVGHKLQIDVDITISRLSVDSTASEMHNLICETLKQKCLTSTICAMYLISKCMSSMCSMPHKEVLFNTSQVPHTKTWD